MIGFGEQIRPQRRGKDIEVGFGNKWVTPWGSVNGGVAAAAAMRAAMLAGALPVPASTVVQFIRPVKAGCAVLVPTIIRPGTRAEALRVAMMQSGELVIEIAAWLVEEADGMEHHEADAPRCPPPGELRSLAELAAM